MHTVTHGNFASSYIFTLLIFFLSLSGQAHEGSSYNSQKTLQMAMHRLDHAKTRVNELEATKTKHMQLMQQHQMQRQQGMQQPPPSM